IFRIEDASFANALKRKDCGTPLEAAEVWPLLDGFFRKEMVRQYPIPGALAAMAAIGAEADIVVPTNVGPEHQQDPTVPANGTRVQHGRQTVGRRTMKKK